jgi:hypothetical protein
VGWLVKAAPLLLASALVLGAAVRLVGRQLRLPLVVLGAAAALSAAVVIYQPFQGVDQLELAARSHGAVGSWVNTGLLPLRLTPLSEEPAQVIATGEVARFRFAHPGEGGRYGVRLSPQAPWLLWAGVVGGCLVPATIETLRRRPGASAVTESPQSALL